MNRRAFWKGVAGLFGVAVLPQIASAGIAESSKSTVGKVVVPHGSFVEYNGVRIEILSSKTETHHVACAMYETKCVTTISLVGLCRICDDGIDGVRKSLTVPADGLTLVSCRLSEVKVEGTKTALVELILKS